MAMKIISVADIGDFKLGNAEDREKGTGCTVIICEKGAVGGVDVRGGGPATRETDLLKSENTVNAVNAVVLSGGSAFGLEAASGVMRELAEMKIGFDVGDDIIVPIVCGASLYDLPVGDHKAFPDVQMGIQAVQNAYEGVFSNGNHGAGTGATVGKLKGYERAMKTGLGTFACGDGVIEVGAIAAVNAVGDIYNGAGNIIAGLRSEDGQSIYGTIKTLKSMVHDSVRLVDESTAFIDKTDIEEALAAVARQFEEERAANGQAPEVIEKVPEAIDEPAVETAEEVFEEQESEEISSQEPAEIFEEVPAEEPERVSSEEHFEEPEEASAEEPGEELAEEPEIEEPEAEAEPEEEFIPETPAVTVTEETSLANDEVSIPAVSAEPEEISAEEPAEEPIEEPEAVVEPAEEFAEEPETEAEPLELAEDPEIEEEPEAEAEPEEPAVEAEPAEEFAEEPEAEEEPAEEFFEEPEPEVVPSEEPALVSEEEQPSVIEETVEETAEEITEEEEPAVLTREEMGYDIVFNTTISCLITNAALTKSQANKLASILHDAYARAIKPVHGTLDGDTVFVLATGKQQVNFDAFAALATDVMQYAVIDGALSAEGAFGLPAAKDMQ